MPDMPCPTESELAILRVLWEREPRSVREVHDVIALTKPVGYTTVLKTMQIMFEKGFVKRDERQKAHLYRAALPAPRVQKQLVDDLVERAFGGAADQLVMHALSGRKASPEEIAQLRSLLAKLEGKRCQEPFSRSKNG
jgi:predicted transcriptional regulator